MRLILLSAIVLLNLVGHSVSGQIIYNPNDERFRQLALEKAIWIYKDCRDEYLRAVALSEKGMLAASELSHVQRVYKIAEIELEQALLALTQEAPHLAIEQASTRQTASGRRILSLTLRNLGQVPLSTHYDSLLHEASDRISLRDLLTLRNVFVSLKDNGTIVAIPYEQRIDSLQAGEAAILQFQLLRELDEVEVCAQFSGKVETKRVLIEKGTGSSLLQITASPIAQVAMFGTRAVYLLEFDRGKGNESEFGLSLRNLPPQYQGYFFDVATEARVYKLVFSPAGVSSSMRLEINLPDRMTPLSDSDSTIHFLVVAESHLNPANLSQIELELAPIGRGEIALSSRNWRQEGTVDDPPTLTLTIENTGSMKLNDIRWEIEGPSGWRISPEMENIASLELGEKLPFRIWAIPPENEIQGEYEIKVRAYTQYGGARIESDKKTFRIGLKSGGNALTVFLLVLFGIASMAAVIWFAKRLGKR